MQSVFSFFVKFFLKHVPVLYTLQQIVSLDSLAIPFGGERVTWVCINLCVWPVKVLKHGRDTQARQFLDSYWFFSVKLSRTRPRWVQTTSWKPLHHTLIPLLSTIIQAFPDSIIPPCRLLVVAHGRGSGNRGDQCLLNFPCRTNYENCCCISLVVSGFYCGKKYFSKEKIYSGSYRK